MKRKLILGIVLILIASFSLNLFSCDMSKQNGTTNPTSTTEDIVKETTSQETTDNEIEETVSQNTTDIEIEETVSQETTDIEIEETFSQETTDIEIEETTLQETIDLDVSETTDEETTEDDDFSFIRYVNPRQIFSSLDKLLLAVEDTDAYCDKVQKDSYGRPIDPEFIKEIIELLKPILIPYTDEFSSFSLKVEKSYVYGYYNVGIVFTTENDIKYVFDAYFNIGEFEYPYNYEPEKIPDEESCELKIDNQFVKMHMFQNSYRGVWKNGDVCFEVHVYGKNLTSPEDLIDFYTVDLVELASQRYGEETTEDDYQGCVPMDKRQQIFNSLDELLLAIEDIDAFCEIVTDNGEGEPVEPEFIKEKLSFFSDYPFALIDNCSSIWAELTHNGLQIVLTSKGGTDYTFIYWFDADSFHLANGEVFGEFKIDDQYINMYSFSNLVGLKYSYVGVWTNNDMPVFVGVAGDSEELKSPESFQDQEIYTVDLFELASQRYGEETTSEDSDTEGSETEGVETDSSIAN